MEQKKAGTIRKLSVFVLVFAIVFALTGCLRYEARTRVNADGTVDFSFIYAVSSELGDSLSSGTTDAQKLFADAGWDLEEYKEDKYTGFRATKKHIPIDELEDELKGTGSFDGFTIREESDGEYVLEWDIDSVTSDARSQGVSSDYLTQYGGFMRFVLEVPGKVIESNGKESNNGKSIEWNFFEMNEAVYARFSLGGGIVFPASATITVYKDKTADVSLFFTNVEDMEQFDALEEMGWDISGKSKVTASQEGVDLQDLEDLLITTELGFDGFSFEEEEGIYTLQWDASGKELELVLELPNAPEESNSDGDDEKVLEWDLANMDEPVSAQFKIKKGGGFPILLVCIIAGSVILVGIIILVIVLIAKKKKNKGDNGPHDPNSYVEVPAAPSQSAPIAPSQYVPQAPVNPTSYSSASGLPNPGLPQMGNVPPQGTENNMQS